MLGRQWIAPGIHGRDHILVGALGACRRAGSHIMLHQRAFRNNAGAVVLPAAAAVKFAGVGSVLETHLKAIRGGRVVDNIDFRRNTRATVHGSQCDGGVHPVGFACLPGTTPRQKKQNNKQG